MSKFVDKSQILRRMVLLAQGYLNANEKLSRSLGDFGNSGPLLKALAFEILLKAAWSAENDYPSQFGHDYKKGFYELSIEARRFILLKNFWSCQRL